MPGRGAGRLVLAGLAVLALSCNGERSEPLNDVDLPDDAAALAGVVRQEFAHAWAAYTSSAWGFDELRPLSRRGRNWHDETLLITAVDALDGLILLGFDDEADRTREFIVEHLSFDRDIDVQVFEIDIRLLGGLLSAHLLTGDRRLLALADDLGRRLLPAFDSPTGMPYRRVNLRTGAVGGRHSNPAEVGTSILELGTLAGLTGNAAYYDVAKRALVALYERRSSLGLIGSEIDVVSGAWRETTCHVGGGIDSYFESLWKGWLLFGDEDLRAMWETHAAALRDHLAMEAGGRLWYGRVDMHTGAVRSRRFGALEAFFAGLLARAGDVDRAARLQQSSDAMWALHGLEPEQIDFRTMRIVRGNAGYFLRPEIIESAYQLHRVTGDERYRAMGRTYLAGIMRACRVEGGYAAVGDVRTLRLRDAMDSYFLGETLKYLYLLFAGPGDRLPADVVFTTEAHPLWWVW